MVVAGDGTVDLLPYEQEGAIALLERGRGIIPLWIQTIHQNIQEYSLY